jgi:hypothetical protein
MKRVHFIAATAAVAATRGTGASAAAATTARSLWVWQTSLDDAATVAAFAREHQIATVHFSLPKDDRAAVAAGDAARLRQLQTLATSGLAVYATIGDPEWVEKSRKKLPATVSTILEAHAAHGIFSGIALDLEPHTLAAWKDGSAKDEIAANYVALLGSIHRAAAAQKLPLLATVHPTYAKYSPPQSGSKSLLQIAASATDATVLMAYRNAETTLESFAGAAMTQLAASAHPWWLGVSTHTGSPAGTSYATLPPATLFSSIDKTATDLAARYGASFAGIAVEDYRNTVALLDSSAR